MHLVQSTCLNPKQAHRPALCQSGTGWTATYAELAGAVASLTALLRQAGIGRGDRVALLAPASPEFVVGLLAACSVGAAAAPVDTSLRGLSLEAAFDRLAPDAVVGTAGALRRGGSWLERVKTTIAFEPCDEAAALAGTARIRGSSQAFRLAFAGTADGAPTASSAAAATDDALLVATSGSTGQPKYVRLSHGGTLFNITGHLQSLGLNGPFRALQALDISYSYGLVASLLATLAGGGTVVLPAHSDARSMRRAIVDESPSVCLASPALLEYLIDTCPEQERSCFANLRTVGIGGDRCREPLRRKIRGAMPEAAVYITYGITEAGPRVATLPPEDLLARPHAVGLPLAGVDLAVIDGDGEPCGTGTVGLLQVRTPSRMNGYLGEAAWAAGDDWLPTSDLASLDADGCLTIHGRADRQFKHRGRRVNPAQIELVLERFPGVVSARVELAEGDEGRLKAVVHHRPAAEGSIEDRLREHCRRNLPSRLVPAEILPVVESDGYFFKGRRLALREA